MFSHFAAGIVDENKRIRVFYLVMGEAAAGHMTHVCDDETCSRVNQKRISFSKTKKKPNLY